MAHPASLIALNEIAGRQQLPLLASVAVQVAVVLTRWEARRRTRKQLAKLEAYQLDDIGLTPFQAKTESQKPFWL